MTTTYATRTRKANAYAGACSKCTGHVPAQTGYLGSKVSGRWTVEHTECPAADPAPAETPKRAALQRLRQRPHLLPGVVLLLPQPDRTLTMTCRTASGTPKNWTHTIPDETVGTPMGPWQVHDRDCRLVGTIKPADDDPPRRDVFGHPMGGTRKEYEAYSPDDRLVAVRRSVLELEMDLQRAADMSAQR